MKNRLRVQLWMLQAAVALTPLAQAPGPVDYAAFDKSQILQDLSCYAPGSVGTQVFTGGQTTVLQ